jgi:hypothetical protein
MHKKNSLKFGVWCLKLGWQHFYAQNRSNDTVAFLQIGHLNGPIQCFRIYVLKYIFWLHWNCFFHRNVEILMYSVLPAYSPTMAYVHTKCFSSMGSWNFWQAWTHSVTSRDILDIQGVSCQLGCIKSWQPWTLKTYQ